MASIYDPIPNSPFYSPQTNSLLTPQGSVIAGNGVSIDQFGVMNVASTLGGTVTSVTAGTGLTGGVITVAGTIGLAPATNVSLGGIRVGANLLIAPDGTLSALPPGTGTINNIVVTNGLIGGGTGPVVNISLTPATTSQLGGVVVGAGINVVGGAISLASATTGAAGGVQLATSAEVIAGTDATKAVTPAALATKTASLLRPGFVQLSDNPNLTSSTLAATPTAVKAVNTLAAAASTKANAALARTGGTMTGIIAFAPGQTFPGVALPKATTLSLGVVQVGPGLNIGSTGILSTANNGTVTAIVAGPGLGAPATGNVISNSGTLRLLPPTADGSQLGGVKAGANVQIGVDGTISVPTSTFIATNNPFSFNGYQWPISRAAPALPCPGENGQVLTISNNVTGELAWTNTGTLSGVVAGPGIAVTSSPSTATVSLAAVPSIAPGSFGGTALIPTFAVNEYGQITSTGQANPFTGFQIPTNTAPFILVLNFGGNNTNWQWTLQDATTIDNPLNAASGQTGAFLISQNPIVPYNIAWGSSWKFGAFTPYTGNPTPAAVDMIEFRVVDTNYIVVTNIVQNIG